VVVGGRGREGGRGRRGRWEGGRCRRWDKGWVVVEKGQRGREG
jgi:hypothetical protein